MDSRLAELLESLALSDHAGKLANSTLHNLKKLHGDELAQHLDAAGLPGDARDKLAAAVAELKQKAKEKRKKSELPLPEGWKVLTDEKTGRSYYWNTVTNEVSWTRPEAPAVPAAPKSPVLARYKPGELSLSSFQLCTTLGTGAYGRVRLAKDKRTSQFVALKILKKSEIIRLKQVDHIKSEKAILEKANHPFIVNILGSFQDAVHLYFALEFVPGGELFTVLRKRKRFNNDVSVFYAAQVVLAFEHLHKKNIVYRDLKPENLLFSRDGYLRITDFGFAKEVADDSRTYTICGTPEYLAPEIIQTRGHSLACDWWALGILVFEMLSGHPPFESDNPYNIYKLVLKGQIEWPKMINDTAKDLISQLLHPKPAYRLGNLRGGADDVKAHPWFKDLDWEALARKDIRAPFLPKVKADDDTSNFGKYGETDKVPGEPVSEDVFPEFGKF